MRIKLICLLGLINLTLAAAPVLETKPDAAYFEKFQPVKAPAVAGPALKQGDRLAICGDSITEQKLYSRIMEDYLTMCAPQYAGDGAAIWLERRKGAGLPGADDERLPAFQSHHRHHLLWHE
jgi:hypothetical protein